MPQIKTDWLIDAFNSGNRTGGTVSDDATLLLLQLEMIDFMLVHPNTVSVMYQIPQYVLITAGEILFSIPGLSFAYSQVVYAYSGSVLEVRGFGGISPFISVSTPPPMDSETTPLNKLKSKL